MTVYPAHAFAHSLSQRFVLRGVRAMTLVAALAGASGALATPVYRISDDSRTGDNAGNRAVAQSLRGVGTAAGVPVAGMAATQGSGWDVAVAAAGMAAQTLSLGGASVNPIPSGTLMVGPSIDGTCIRITQRDVPVGNTDTGTLGNGSLLTTATTLQSGAPRPTSMWSATQTEAFWNETGGASTNNNGALFEFFAAVSGSCSGVLPTKAVRGFGAWFGDLESSSFLPSTVQTFNASGMRISMTNVVGPSGFPATCISSPGAGTQTPGPGNCGNETTRWVGFTDTAATPTVTSMLVVVGDVAVGGRGFTEHISFIGPTVAYAMPTVNLYKQTLNGFSGPFSFALSNTTQATGSVSTTVSGVAAQVDGDTLTSGIQSFTAVALNTAISINENALPANWTLTGATCTNALGATVGSLTGSSYTIPAAAVVPDSTFSCTFTNTANPAILTVSKTISGVATSVIGTAMSFPFSVNCQTPTATYNGSVVIAAGTLSGSTTVSLPAGSTSCSLAETLATRSAAPAGYAWVAPTYTQPASPVTPGGTPSAAMINALSSGALTISKSVSMPLPQAASFSFTLNCTAPSTTPATTALGAGVSTVQTICIAAGGSTGSVGPIGPIADGSTCSVTESTPNHIPNYSWGTTPGPNTPINITNGNTAGTSFTNTLSRSVTAVSGRVYVEASSPANTTDDGNAVDPSIVTNVWLSCSSPSFNAGPATTNADGTYSFSGVPAGATCTITESQPPGYTNAYNRPGVGGSANTGGVPGTFGDSSITLTVPETGSTGNNFAEQSADMTSATVCTPSLAMPGTVVSCTVTCTNNGPGMASNAFCSVVNASQLPGSPSASCASNANLAAGSNLVCTINFVAPIQAVPLTVTGGTGASNDSNGGGTAAAGNNPSSATVSFLALPVPAVDPRAWLMLLALLAASGLWGCFTRRRR